MVETRLVELINGEGNVSYGFPEFPPISRIDELICYSFEDKSSADWRKIALQGADKVKFPFGEFFGLFSKNENINSMINIETSNIAKREEFSFFNYHNPRNLRKYFDKGGILDMASLASGVMSGLWRIDVGIGIFAIMQLANEYSRRDDRKLIELELKHVREGIEKYCDFRKDILDARIHTKVPQGAKDIIVNVRKVNQSLKYGAIDFEKANKDLMHVYDQS